MAKPLVSCLWTQGSSVCAISNPQSAGTPEECLNYTTCLDFRWQDLRGAHVIIEDDDMAQHPLLLAWDVAVTKCTGQQNAWNCQWLWICTFWRDACSGLYKGEIQERPMFSWETVVWWKRVLWEDLCWSVLLWYSQKPNMKHWDMFWGGKNWKSYRLDCGFCLIFLSMYHWSILRKNVVHWEVT